MLSRTNSAGSSDASSTGTTGIDALVSFAGMTTSGGSATKSSPLAAVPPALSKTVTGCVISGDTRVTTKRPGSAPSSAPAGSGAVTETTVASLSIIVSVWVARGARTAGAEGALRVRTNVSAGSGT